MVPSWCWIPKHKVWLLICASIPSQPKPSPSYFLATCADLRYLPAAIAFSPVPFASVRLLQQEIISYCISSILRWDVTERRAHTQLIRLWKRKKMKSSISYHSQNIVAKRWTTLGSHLNDTCVHSHWTTIHSLLAPFQWRFSMNTHPSPLNKHCHVGTVRQLASNWKASQIRPYQ